MEHRKLERKTWLPCVGEIERRRTINRRRDWHESCAAIHGPKERKKKTQGGQRVIVRRLNPSSSTNQRILRSLFPRPDVATVSHFAVFADVDVQLQDGRAAARGSGKAKKSSHPWHFRYWSLRRNELECTNLVRWTEALHRFSPRDAIIVVGSVLEKYFGGDFTRDQEKENTFKRWPPGHQSWKLGVGADSTVTCQVLLA